MKFLGLFIIFCLAVVGRLEAQTGIYVPLDLSTPIVVVGTAPNGAFVNGWQFTIDDGTNPAKTGVVGTSKSYPEIVSYAEAIAEISNKICKQGYKLMSSNSVGEAGCIYIFQKE